MGAVRGRMTGADSGRSVIRGVSAQVGEQEAAIDLEIVVEYGFAIPDVAAEVRESVQSAVERMAGREVVEANPLVGDVKLPDEQDQEEDRQRIQ